MIVLDKNFSSILFELLRQELLRKYKKVLAYMFSVFLKNFNISPGH